MATGGVRFWNDGRDVPDMMLGLCDYPETKSHPAFNLTLQTNFAHGGGGGTEMRLIGSEGIMNLGFRGLKISRNPRYAPTKKQVIEGYNSVRTFSKSVQQEISNNFEQYYPDTKTSQQEKTTLDFKIPKDYDERFDHFVNFFNAIRSNKTVIEDAKYGLRASAAAILTNTSYLKKRPIRWNPEKMSLQ